jgi:hypothetical protein
MGGKVRPSEIIKKKNSRCSQVLGKSTCKMRARKEKKLVFSCKIMGPQKQSVRLF